MISGESETVSLPLLKQLLQHKLQQGKRSGLLLHLSQQVANHVFLEGHLYIGKRSGLLNRCLQFLPIHREDRLALLLDEAPEFRIVHWPVVEVATQRQNEQQGTTWLSTRGDKELDEVLPFPFVGRLSEEFFALIDHEHHGWYGWRHQLCCQHMEAATAFLFEVFTNGEETSLAEGVPKRCHKRFNGVFSWD